MAIKQAKYNITLQNGEDVYHFQTDDEMVKILDSNKNVLGTFKEYGLEGKVVNSGSFKELKVTGIYKIKGVTGLPSGYDVGKISILSVKAIGVIQAPTLVSYELISQSGEIYSNTVFGDRESGWSAGGTTLKNTITNMTSQIGDVANLQTNSKASLVNAVNELKLNHDTTEEALDILSTDYSEFKQHNHNRNYIRKSGDEMTGHLAITNNNYLRGKSANDANTYDLLGVDSGNNINLGDSSRKLVLRGSDLRNKDNGKVWHEGNHGESSGLDADLLDGRQGSAYAVLNQENRFSNSLISEGEFYADKSIYFGKNYAGRRNSISSTATGNIRIGEQNYTEIDKATGGISTEGDIVLSSRARWTKLMFTGESRTALGVGFERSKNSGTLTLHDWENKNTGFVFNGKNGTVNFSNRLQVKGRDIYLQSATPTGSIPTGSIWIS